jgi:hypothetical protein
MFLVIMKAIYLNAMLSSFDFEQTSNIEQGGKQH